MVERHLWVPPAELSCQAALAHAAAPLDQHELGTGLSRRRIQLRDVIFPVEERLRGVLRRHEKVCSRLERLS